jgi:hypothetical protein
MSNHNYKAANEAIRIMNLNAFNIIGAIKKRRWNQHAITYYFDDESQLTLYLSQKRSSASSNRWQGKSRDTHLRPCVGLPIKVNK